MMSPVIYSPDLYVVKFRFLYLFIFYFLLQLPWKTLASIVEYYYMWKTSDRYIQQKRLKATENESKLKQVYIPN